MDDGESVSRLQRRRARRRQPLVEFDPRPRPGDGRSALALPVHTARSPRLGFGADRGRRGYAFPWHAAQVLLQANRNGFFYVLDRESGAAPRHPIHQESQLGKRRRRSGRPQRIAGMEPSWRGTTVCPSVVGATNWMAPAFNPDTRLYYVMALERCSIFQKSSRWFEQGESFYGGSTRNVPAEGGGKCCARSTSRPAGSRGRCRRSATATHGAACSRPHGLALRRRRRRDVQRSRRAHRRAALAVRGQRLLARIRR